MIFPPWVKIVGPIVAVLVLVLLGAWQYQRHYQTGYEAGVEAQKQAQRTANDEAERTRQADKEALEKNAKLDIAKAKADADSARTSADRLRDQLAQIRRLGEQYSGAIPTGTATRSTVDLLADVLGQSIDRNRQLAKYADDAAAAGRVCERQYDALRK